MQRRLQSTRQGLALFGEQVQQQIQRLGAAVQFLIAAVALVVLRLFLVELFFQPFRSPGFQPDFDIAKFAAPVLLGLAQLIDRILVAFDILPEKLRAGFADFPFAAFEAGLQFGLLFFDVRQVGGYLAELIDRILVAFDILPEKVRAGIADFPFAALEAGL